MVPRSSLACYESDGDVDKKPVIFSNAPLVISPVSSCHNTCVRNSAAHTVSTSEQSFANSNNESPLEHIAAVRSTCQPSSPAASDRSVAVGYTENAEPSTKARKVTYAKWSKEEQRLLVQMWCDHMKTSRMEKPNWRLMASRLSVKRKITGTQCQRKMKYLRDLYREAKAYNEKNKNQPWEDRETSPYYHEIDAVLTCQGTPNFNHVGETSGMAATRTATSTANEFVATPDVSEVPMFNPPRILAVGSQKDAATSFSTQQRLAYWNTINCTVSFPEADTEDDHGLVVETAPNSSPEIRVRRKRRKKNQDKSDDNDSTVFRETMEQLQAQGDRISAAMEAMLEAQNQQFEMMTNFMNTLLQHIRGQKLDDNHIA